MLILLVVYYPATTNPFWFWTHYHLQKNCLLSGGFSNSSYLLVDSPLAQPGIHMKSLLSKVNFTEKDVSAILTHVYSTNSWRIELMGYRVLERICDGSQYEKNKLGNDGFLISMDAKIEKMSKCDVDRRLYILRLLVCLTRNSDSNLLQGRDPRFLTINRFESGLVCSNGPVYPWSRRLKWNIGTLSSLRPLSNILISSSIRLGRFSTRIPPISSTLQ